MAREIYFKDKFIDTNQAIVPVDDRSFRFGDGVFDTILVASGKMYDPESHFERLAQGLKYFKIELDISNLPEICEEIIKKNSLESGYVRIIVSRGNGSNSVGYLPKDSKAYFVVQTVEAPFPEFKSIKLWISEHRASLHLPSKVNSSMLYTMAMLEAEENSCDNALLLNSDGIICETASGNIFWVKNEVIYTPSTDLPFVPGTIRKKILELSPYKIKQGNYTIDDLNQADEVFMTNIGHLVASVKSIEPLGWKLQKGSITKELRQLLVENIVA